MTRQKGLIITIITAVVIGCPSLFCCLFGLISAAGGGTFELGQETGQVDPTVGIGLVCLSIIGLAVPVAAWYFTMRGKTA